MWWTVCLLGLLILIGFGVAIYMAEYHHGVFSTDKKRRKKPVARKTKSSQVTIIRQEANGIDIEELVAKVATAVASKVSEDMLKKIKELGYNLPARSRREIEEAIKIDESIIPVAVESTVDHINLDKMATEEETKDEGLAKSKSKLAELLRKKNG